MRVAILAGGAGTRLWPVSRARRPKPFLRIDAGRSLLQDALARATAAGAEEILVVVRSDLAHLARAEIDDFREPIAPVHLMLEPVARGTAAAVAAAALWSSARDASPLLVLPADHRIRDLDRFRASVAAAVAAAQTRRIVLFGIRPARAATEFGYFECATTPGGRQPEPVRRFVEKPDLEVAVRLVAEGRHFWNSGMFCFAPELMLSEFERHAPGIVAAARSALATATEPSGGDVALGADYALAPTESLDRAIIERSERVSALAAAFDWDDIGHWNAVAATRPADADGNSSAGNAVLADCRNTHVEAGRRIVAAVGVRDAVIVDTDDALLVVDRAHVQQVGTLVEELRRRGAASADEPSAVARPWGRYWVLDEGPGYKVKRIEVAPHRALSLQRHAMRSEHWVVVSGAARVTLDGTMRELQVDDSAFVPLGAVHRLENPHDAPLVMIEVQMGRYVGEDDIERLGGAETAAA